jgi:hypothetical protein
MYIEYRSSMFENRVQKDKVKGEWRKLHNEELRDLYSSSNIIQVIILRIMKQKEHVAYIGERSGAYRVLVRKPEGKDHLEDLGRDGRHTLKWIFMK